MNLGFFYNDVLSLQAPPGPIPPDKDVIPLCCCKINGACFKKLGSSVTYCQALDSVDGKVRSSGILITYLKTFSLYDKVQLEN